MDTENNLQTETEVDSQQAQDAPKTAQELLAFGKQQGLNFTHRGWWPLPSEPVQTEKYLIVPAHLDKSDVPLWAMRRVRMIEQAGFRPKGYVIVHELTPTETRTAAPNRQRPDFSRELAVAGEVGREAGAVAGSVLKVAAGAALVVGGLLVAATVTAIPVMLSGLAAFDPILIACMDGENLRGPQAKERRLTCWIELDRWDD